MRRIVGSSILVGTLLFAVAAKKPTPPKTSAQSKSKNSKSAALATGFGNSDAISQDELKVYDYFLASDQLEGRNLPSRGYDTAALYVASHLKEWGLKPGGSTTGTDGPLQPYFMPIDLETSALDAAATKLTLTLPPPAAGTGGRGARGGGGGGFAGGRGAAASGPRDFEYAKEWTAGAGAGGGRGAAAPEAADITDAELVFVGDGYVINKTNSNPYQGVDVRGKVMVVAGEPAELAARAAAAGGRGGRGAAGPDPLGKLGVDYESPQSYAQKNGAVAIISLPTFAQLTAMSSPNAGGGRGPSPNGPAYQVVAFQNRVATVPTITAGIELTNSLFQGETRSAAQIFDGAAGNVKEASFALNPAKKISIHIAVTTQHNHGENVIGMIEGSDPVLKSQFIVISAHLDHIGLSIPNAQGDGINNGADDDGSGSTGLLGIAHAYAEGAAKGMRPKRTIIFLWNAGEEKGLWGSQYFAEFPPVDISKIVLDLNMDMIGRTKKPGEVDPDKSHLLVNPGEVLVVGPDISSNDLEKQLEAVNTSYQKLNINHFYDTTAPDATHDNLGPTATGQRIFYRSDHYNFAKVGIPIAFFTDGLHEDYHKVTDSPDKIDFREIQQVSQTVSALAWTVGNEPDSALPKLNATLPPQLITDMAAAKAAGWGKLTPVLPPLPGMPF